MTSFLKCYDCNQTHAYTLKDSFCFHCGNRIVDEGIKPLVFALNLFGIKTERSCEGHYDFDRGVYDYPWVIIAHEEDRKKLKDLVHIYNLQGYGYEWEVGYIPTSDRYLLYPADRTQGLKILHLQTQRLASFINSLAKLRVN